MGITTHSKPYGRESRFNGAFERNGNEMRPEAQDRPLRSVATDTAPDDTNESLVRATRRRLGHVEYLLLAVIALGVAITIAMAVVDPSG